MDVPQIKDREHLEAWLKTRSREECIAIAHRAAMRVAPLWIGMVGSRYPSENYALTEVQFFRALLTSGCAAKKANREIESASLSTAKASDKAAKKQREELEKKLKESGIEIPKTKRDI